MRGELDGKVVSRWNWITVSVGVAVFTWLTGMAALMGVILFMGPSSEWLGVIVCGAWTSAVVGLVLGSWPRQWLRAAIISWILMMAAGLGITLVDPSMGLVVLSGVFSGGVLVLGIHAKCSGRASWKWAAFVAVMVCLYHVGKIWDFPAIPDRYEKYQSEGIERTYRFDLGGFGRGEILWRFDGETEEILDHLKDRFEVEPVAELPERFFQMNPHYWPERIPDSASLYASANFVPPPRVPEREQCVALVDPEAKRVYVWMKQTIW